ncbi:MAG: hypothetical protein GQ532_14545 [Methylomarinum sp.]|nr:hypothetical protein [Methylomarinum sp.]
MAEDFGIIYEGDFSVRIYSGNTLSKRLIGPLEATSFSVKAENEQKERKALRVGQSGKTRGAFGRGLATKVKFGVNAVSAELLSLILLGATLPLSIAGGSAVAESVDTEHGVAIKLNNGNITSATATITGSVEGPDYVIDKALGSITTLATGNLAASATVDISYDFGAITGTRVKVGTETKMDVMLEGPVVNSETGAKGWLKIPKVTLSPANELALLGDDYVTADLDGSCVLLDTESADLYFDPSRVEA